MKAITMQQFLVRQPSFPEEQPTDIYYLKLSNRLLDITVGSHLLDGMPDVLVQRAVLTVIGYYQDVIADGGVWRAFITESRRLYGRTLPFYTHGEDYIDYELNREDVRFIVWYAIAMSYEKMRMLSPDSELVRRVSDLWYEELEARYDDAPEPEGYRVHQELEISNPADGQGLLKLANWLFMHNYLLTPAFALTLSHIMAEPGLSEPDNMPKLYERLEQAMMEDPTGPLALYLREWIYLILEGHLPPAAPAPADGEEAEKIHPYYEKFVAATDGKTIAFFSDYESLNRFFIDVLGWSAGEEHLPQLKDAHDFILMVNRQKGMLLAKDIARCIAAPSNPCYDASYARTHAIDLLTERGRCPHDLLERIWHEGWLPDAVFPGDYPDEESRVAAHSLVAENHDFIARCYLQQYYRGD